MKSDNLRPASWTDAGYSPNPSDYSSFPIRCEAHGVIYAACRECAPEMAAHDPCTEDPEPWLRDDGDASAWVGALLLLAVFALGVAAGWLLGGVAP